MPTDKIQISPGSDYASIISLISVFQEFWSGRGGGVRGDFAKQGKFLVWLNRHN